MRYAPGVNRREGRPGGGAAYAKLADGEDTRVRTLGVEAFETLLEVRGRCARRRGRWRDSVPTDQALATLDTRAVLREFESVDRWERGSVAALVLFRFRN